MGTNTGAALRAVEDLDDPLEVATREVGQIEAEKLEISAKLQELRTRKAAADAVIASGDHRKVDDAFLTRGLTIERGIAAMERALEVSEARRIQAEERAGQIRMARLRVESAAAVEEHRRLLATATDELTTAAKGFATAILNRGRALAAAEGHAEQARGYGVQVARLVPTSEVLAGPEVVAALREAGLRLELGARPTLFVT